MARRRWQDRNHPARVRGPWRTFQSRAARWSRVPLLSDRPPWGGEAVESVATAGLERSFGTRRPSTPWTGAKAKPEMMSPKWNGARTGTRLVQGPAGSDRPANRVGLTTSDHARVDRLPVACPGGSLCRQPRMLEPTANGRLGRRATMNKEMEALHYKTPEPVGNDRCVRLALEICHEAVGTRASPRQRSRRIEMRLARVG